MVENPKRQRIGEKNVRPVRRYSDDKRTVSLWDADSMTRKNDSCFFPSPRLVVYTQLWIGQESKRQNEKEKRKRAGKKGLRLHGAFICVLCVCVCGKAYEKKTSLVLGKENVEGIDAARPLRVAPCHDGEKGVHVFPCHALYGTMCAGQVGRAIDRTGRGA